MTLRATTIKQGVTGLYASGATKGTRRHCKIITETEESLINPEIAVRFPSWKKTGKKCPTSEPVQKKSMLRTIRWRGDTGNFYFAWVPV